MLSSQYKVSLDGASTIVPSIVMQRLFAVGKDFLRLHKSLPTGDLIIRVLIQRHPLTLGKVTCTVKR